MSEATSDTSPQTATAHARPGDAPAAVHRRRIAVARLRDLALIPAIIAIAIVGQVVSPVFLRTDNLINVLQTMSEIAVLVLISPTAGVDVRSKEFLLGKVEQTAAHGTGVLIASDELDDLRVCDRVLVLFQGRVVAEMAPGWHDHALVAAMEGVDLHV